MALTPTPYGQSAIKALNGESWQVVLCDSTYSPNQDTHKSYSADVTGEISGDGYTSGGVEISNAAVTYDAASNTLTLDGDDVSLDPSTLTARTVVIKSGDDLLAFATADADVSSSGGPFQVAFDSAGIITVAV